MKLGERSNICMFDIQLFGIERHLTAAISKRFCVRRDNTILYYFYSQIGYKWQKLRKGLGIIL